MGITFNVYGADGGTERIFPFDIVPRIIDGREAVTFLRRIKDCIEAPERLLYEV